MVLVGWDMGNRKDGPVGWSTVSSQIRGCDATRVLANRTG